MELLADVQSHTPARDHSHEVPPCQVPLQLWTSSQKVRKTKGKLKNTRATRECSRAIAHLDGGQQEQDKDEGEQHEESLK